MLGKRLINTGSAAAGGSCTTDTLQILGDTSCIAYYKMSDATDESGNYDGTPSNVNFNVAGKFGNAGSFNGSSSKIEAINSALSSNTIRSYSVWFKKSSSSEKMILANNNGSTYGAHIAVSAGNQLNGWVYNEEQNNYYFNLLGGSVTFNVWHHAVLTWGVNASDCVLYLNGASVATASSVNGNVPTTTAPNNFKIGDYTGNLFWNGSIDQIRIFNKALSSTEVTTLNDEVYCQPTIVPTDNFEPVIYTGNGTTQSITSLNFKPDWVWVKCRSFDDPSALVDSVRGASETLFSDNTSEQKNRTSVTSFNSNGFTLGNYTNTNRINDTYVAWNWKAAATTTTIAANTVGNTIASDVRANVDAGFSIVSYTGNGNTSQQSYGHGLSSAPELVINKARDTVTQGTNHWIVGGTLLGNGGYMFLSLTNAKNTASSYNGNQVPDSNVVYISGTSDLISNENNKNFISYCFHSVDGYSKIGSYTGTGASGNSIVTGFRPAFVMLKRTDFSGSWNIIDNRRGNDAYIQANTSAAEGNMSTGSFDLASNGFILNNSFGEWNASGGSYIYMAIAEEVFNPNGVTRNATNPFGDASELALYKFESDGTDSEGNYTTTTLPNVTFASGYIGNAAVFNGSSSYIDTSGLLSLFGSKNTNTVSLWFKTTTTNYSTLFSDYASTSLNNSIDLNGSGNIEVFTRYSNTTSTISTTSGNYNDGNWHNVVHVVDTSGLTSTLYIDGSQIGSSVSISSNSWNGAATQKVTIGALYYTVGSFYQAFFNGSIDQVRIFDRALDSGEVTQLYNE